MSFSPPPLHPIVAPDISSRVVVMAMLLHDLPAPLSFSRPDRAFET